MIHPIHISNTDATIGISPLELMQDWTPGRWLRLKMWVQLWLRRLLPFLFLLTIFHAGIFAQVAVNPVRVVPTDPSGACPPARIDLSTATGSFFYCDPMSGTWVIIASGGGGSVTQINTTAPIAGGPITTTGTLTCDVASALQPGCLSSADWSTFNAKGSGTVTSIATTSPLGGGTITGTGTLTCSTCVTGGSLTSGQLIKGNTGQAITVGDLSGDVTTSGSLVTTVVKVDGIAYSATGAAHSVPVITTANTTATYKAVTDCTDTGGNHLNFTQSTDTFSCGTSSSGSGITIGTTTITSGTTTRVLYDNAGLVGEYTVSGSGNVAMTTSPTFVMPVLGTPTSGNASNMTNIPVANATGILPAANGGGDVLIETHTASASATIDFTTCINGSYSIYRIDWISLVTSGASNPGFRFSTDGGATYDATANIYEWIISFGYPNNGSGAGGQSTYIPTRDLNTTLTSGGSISGSWKLYNPASTTLQKQIIGQMLYGDASVIGLEVMSAGIYKSATAVNAFQIYMNTGTMTTGTFNCYGVR